MEITDLIIEKHGLKLNEFKNIKQLLKENLIY